MSVAAELRWAVATHPGNVRESNQDATLSGPNVFAVADGMGGHACGELASATAITRLAEVTDCLELTAETVLLGIDEANRAVLTVTDARPDCAGMGTTLAGVAILAGEDAPVAIAFNVGDSRVYHWSSGDTDQVSRDHSVVAELVRNGEIDPEDARSHPSRHIVTRALGLSPEMETDRWMLNVEPGDRFLVCSDGLFNELEDGELHAALSSKGSPQDVVDQLLNRVLTRAALDNISVVLVEISSMVTTSANASEDTQPRPATSPRSPSASQ